MSQSASIATSNQVDFPTTSKHSRSHDSSTLLTGFPSIGKAAPTSSNTTRANVFSGVIVPPVFLVASLFGVTTDAGANLISHELSSLVKNQAGTSGAPSKRPTVDAPESVNTLPKNKISNSLTRIHTISGLTWEEIAYLLGVSRRAVHNWLNGLKVSSKNARNLAELHRIIQKVDRGDPASTRAHLLASRENGVTLYEYAMVAARSDRSNVEIAFDPMTLISLEGD